MVYDRFYKYKTGPFLDSFQHDVNNIVHCSHFRKLERKSRLFSPDLSDYTRTRLTHCLEVACMARSVAIGLGLNLSLIEAIALASNLGCVAMGGSGGLSDAVRAQGCAFDEKNQALRVVGIVEDCFMEYKGLNLSHALCDGLLKQRGAVVKPDSQISSFLDAHPGWGFDLSDFGSLEAQAVRLIDVLVQNIRDLEDGFRCDLLTFDQLCEAPFLGRVLSQMYNTYTKPSYLVFNALRKITDKLILDIVRQTNSNLESIAVDARYVQALELSPSMASKMDEISDFVQRNVREHQIIQKLSSIAYNINNRLFNLYYNNMHCLPDEWQTKISISKSRDSAVLIVADFVSGMTDRYASNEYRKYVSDAVGV